MQFTMVAFIIAEMFFLGSVIYTEQTAHAQSTSYLQYSNSLIGLDIKYPNDWAYGEETSSPEYAYTDFIPPSYVPPDISSVPLIYVEIARLLNPPYKNMPLDPYFEYTKNLMLDNSSILYGTKKISLSDGTPAYEINVLDVLENNTKKTIRVFTKSPESYYFVYSATQDKFDTYLPIAEEMFKSLSFIKLQR
jgi:hypothetical protein